VLVVTQQTHLIQISLVKQAGKEQQVLNSQISFLVCMLVIYATNASQSNFFGYYAGNG
jgi:hypothetical protein